MIAFDHRDCEQEHYIPSYRMNLEDAANGREAASAAVLTGWLALLQSGSHTIQVDVGQSAGSYSPQVGSVAVMDRQGSAGGQADRPQACLYGLLEAQGLPEMDFCELRFLTIPGLLFQGFWLRSNNPKERCRISPLFFLEECVKDQVYTMPEFLAVIRPFAQLRLGQLDNSPR